VTARLGVAGTIRGSALRRGAALSDLLVDALFKKAF
jgi:hypothetical protein